MKFTAIIILAACLQVSAKNGYSQNLTMSEKNASLEKILKKVKAQTGYDFWCESNLLKKARNVDVQVKNVSLEQLLNICFENQPLSYSIVETTIIIQPKVSSPAKEVPPALPVEISGTVTDSAGEPLKGASVKLKGAKAGTVTDEKGNYTLKIPDTGGELEISYVGYVTYEVTVSKSGSINVSLKLKESKLNEIVIIGYGTVRKRDLTGSVSSMKSDEVTSIPVTNAIEALQGKIAGLDISKNDGEAGSGLNFTLRGNRSLNASNVPLILVDGIPYGSTIDINTSDIASIDVLKDASSTAIYGSRGANGVILITTKKGKTGKPVLAFNAYYGVQSPAGLANIMTGDQYVQFKREAFRTAGITDDTKIFNPDELTAINGKIYTDWMRNIIRNGAVQNYELSMSGGSEKNTYNLSFGSYNEQGLLKNDKLKRYNGSLGATFKLTDNVKVGADVLYTYKENNKRQDPLNLANKVMPFGKPYDSAGNIIQYPVLGSSFAISPLIDEVPGAYVDNIVSKRMIASTNLEWKIRPDLSFKTAVAFDLQSDREGFFYGKYTIAQNGTYSASGINTYTYNNLNWENTLNYNKKIGLHHDFNFLVGHSLLTNSIETLTASGTDQVSDLNSFYNLGSNASQVVISSKLVESKLLSYFGRINYKLFNKYLLTASYRADGASQLAQGHKWGYFPSVAGAWIISDEPFMKKVTVVSNLKLRASWGESGNSAVNPYSTLGGLSRSVYAFNEVAAYGYFPSNISNPDLKWERTAVTNLAVDFDLLKSRVTGTVEYYQSKTRDLLMSRSLPATSGFSTVWQNVGRTENKGIEIELVTKNFLSKRPGDFSWTSTITYTRNKEKIVELAGNVDRDLANNWFVGSPTSVYYDYNKIGIWQLGQETDAAKYGQKPGDIRVQDVGNKGSITADKDRMIVGTPRPKFTFGLNNKFTYRNFDVAVFVYGRIGQMIQSEASGNYKISGLENGPMVDYWTPEHATNSHPRPNKDATSNSAYMSTLYYVDGSFVKIRDINLGYELTNSSLWLKKINVSKIRVYTTLKNFFTFSHMQPYDPERGGLISFPMTKIVVLGVNVNF